MKQIILRNSFRYSLQRTVPILIGFLPVGTAYGILMANAGYNFLWSAFASLFVYAGSLQMLMVSFLTAATPPATVAVTALLLNSRHIFYGLSFIEKFKGYGAWKYFLIYGMPDESYSLLCSFEPKEGVEEKWVHVFSTALLWLYWIAFSMLGGLIGSLIPFDMTGIDFALTALFIIILTDQCKGAATAFPALAAAISSVIWILIVGTDSFLLPSLLTTSCLLVLCRSRIESKQNNKKEAQ